MEKIKSSRIDAQTTLRKFLNGPIRLIQGWTQSEITDDALKINNPRRKDKEQARVIKAIAQDGFIALALDANGNGILEESDLEKVALKDKKKGISIKDIAIALNDFKEDTKRAIEILFYTLMGNKFKGGSITINTYAPEYKSDGRTSVVPAASYPAESPVPLDSVNSLLLTKALDVFGGSNNPEFVRNMIKHISQRGPVNIQELHSAAEEYEIDLPRLDMRKLYDEEEKDFLENFPQPDGNPPRVYGP